MKYCVILFLVLVGCSEHRNSDGWFDVTHNPNGPFIVTETVYFEDKEGHGPTFFQFDEKHSVGVVGHGFYAFKRKWHESSHTSVELPGGEIMELVDNHLYYIWADNECKAVVFSYPYTQKNIMLCLKDALQCSNTSPKLSTDLPR